MPQGENGPLLVQRQLQDHVAVHPVRRDQLRTKEGNTIKGDNCLTTSLSKICTQMLGDRLGNLTIHVALNRLAQKEVRYFEAKSHEFQAPVLIRPTRWGDDLIYHL